MSAAGGFAAILLLFHLASFANGQATRCQYMAEAIPREPKPGDLPDIEWSGGWSDWPIIPGPERREVCMDAFIPGGPTLSTQVIYLEEEVDGDVAIAQLNYDGPETPEIVVPFFTGTFNLLGPALRYESGNWLLYVTQRQDYESPGMQEYLFQVRIADETSSVFVSLVIANIDDNPPIIQSFEACQVPELGEAPRLTDCTYEVSDLDGELSTRMMTFRIASDRGDDNIFHIQPTLNPSNWFLMNMTIGLNKTLDFETSPLHIFQVTALDSRPNEHTVTMMVQVENVEHRPPRWVDIFAVQQFNEKTNQTFRVRAIDGDTGINKPIYYRLERDAADTFFRIETIAGGRDGAIFYVDPIDRDELQRELFQLSIVAYKFDNESFATAAPVAIIIDDINDQEPEPLHAEYRVQILEETLLTIDFEQEFGFHDKDLGPHAQYRVHLESEYPENAHFGFYIAPEVGYQRQTFIMGTNVNHTILDYEDIPFQNISLRVVATDMDNPNFTGVAHVYINLINWNDEEPIFEETSLTVRFNETEGEGFFVGRLEAKDRDIGDVVEHSLMGNAAEFLWINQSTGDIYVSTDDAFDYHRQNVFFVQVRADDTLMEPYHTTTTQLVIELEDVNNTPPTLRLPRGSPNVEENVPEGYEITRNITATDPDTTARLRFEIDWETSYATKQGRETPAVEFHKCVDIETIFPDPSTTGSAVGRVVVKEIRPGVTIDFEEFEVLYVTIRVWDDNTTLGLGYDESTFTITIIDMNDNAPEFASGTLAQAFRVRELSATDTVIGSVLATDIDGPLYNQVRYTIFPRGETLEDELEDLVKIDFYTGQISVDCNAAIAADLPPRWNLYYTVIASDKCYAENIEDCPPDPIFWDTKGNITIEIQDTNNRTPFPESSRFNDTVYIFENATSGDTVVQLYAGDDDRDEIYKTVRYQINYNMNPTLLSFFVVDLDSGLVSVQYTTNEVLDRDGDQPSHKIFLSLIDNFYSEGEGIRNQYAELEILVVLLDVNDNAPELPVGLTWSISENEEEGYRLDPDIYAPDKDEPDTDNSRVGYSILDLSVTNRDIEVPQLFNMIQVANVTGELEVAMPLRGYWGTYSIQILAYDHGIPQQMSNETYEIEVRPYNFHAPEFVFPPSGSVVRLARERAVVNGMLALVNGDFMERLAATDEDGLHAGVVTFQVIGNDEAMEFFDVVNEGENQGFLALRQLFTEDTREFEIVIRATDGGIDGGTLSTDSSLSVVFVPTQGDPVFDTTSYNVAFYEQEGGLEERFQLPRALDPKNFRCTDGVDCLPIFYRIVDGNDEGFFSVDPSSNEIFLLRELDRSVSEAYSITVAASNSETASGSPLPGSTLSVNIAVREANPRPAFERSLYLAGISVNDFVGKELLTVRATHSENSPITYTIDAASMVVDQSLEAVRDAALLLNPTSGVLTLNIQPNAAMHGSFEFKVVANDTAGASDYAQTRVYMISTRNRVSFIFFNTVAQVEAQRDFIAQTFSAGFEMVCVLDEVLPATDSNGVAQDELTEVRAHFIDEDGRPVTAEVIEALRSDTAILYQIQRTLSTSLLILQDLVTDISPSDTSTQTTFYALSGLSAVLGLLLVILLITYIVRTRELDRRLQALSMTKYGSVSSALNRVGIAAPGTNKHAIEGSNPIWNEAIRAPDFDTISDMSGDSDLIGIEDLPQFRSDYFPPGDDDSTTGIVRDRPITSHSNNFGFNTTPFSPGFADQQFRRM